MIYGVKVTFVSYSEVLCSKIGATTLKYLLPDVSVQICLINFEMLRERYAAFSKFAMEWGILGVMDQEVSTKSLRETIIDSKVVIVFDVKLVPFVREICSNAIIEICPAGDDISHLVNEKFENLSKKAQGVKVAKILQEFYKIAVRMTDMSCADNLTAFIPVRSKDCDLALATAQFEASINKGIVVYADFRAKNSLPIEIESPIFEFDPTDPHVQDFISIPSGSVLIPSREFSHPENILLSRSWFNFITQLSYFQRIYIVTAPKYLAGEKFSDSYLAAGMAVNSHIIGL